MPPKAKITKEMITDTAFEIARESGWESINVRAVATKLHCSTQPVMYHFARTEDLKQAVYDKADAFHSEYLMTLDCPPEEIMLNIGLNYIRFAIQEPNLFRFLFQSGFTGEESLLDMINSEQLAPLLSLMQDAMNVTEEQTKQIFLTLFLVVHGYASIIVNNSLEFDEAAIANHLENVYNGAILAAQEEKK